MVTALLGAVLALPIIAAPAAAHSPAGVLFIGDPAVNGIRPTNLDVFACVRRGGTNPWDVPAGVPASITEFWGTKTQEQAQQFIDTSVLQVAVNGTSVSNPQQYWQLIPPGDEGGLWLALWLYDTGVATKAGKTITMDFHQELLDGTYDGFDTYPPGTFVDITCTAMALGSRDSSGH